MVNLHFGLPGLKVDLLCQSSPSEFASFLVAKSKVQKRHAGVSHSFKVLSEAKSTLACEEEEASAGSRVFWGDAGFPA